MISMQFGLAAIASLNWLIIVSGAQAENCDLSSTPRASAASFAPVWRASVAPSPGLPPICMYITSPLPIGSAARAGAAIAGDGRRRDAGQKQIGQTHFRFSLSLSGPPPAAARSYSEVRLPPNFPNDPSRAKNACRRCGSSAYM